MGSSVSAFHDPLAPDRAVLRTGARGGVWLQVMVLGLVAGQLLIAGFALLRLT